VDSGFPFIPNVGALGQFLMGLPRLSGEQRDGLELPQAPFSLMELEAAIEQAASSSAPGLNGHL
jgi:hypothetical protein